VRSPAASVHLPAGTTLPTDGGARVTVRAWRGEGSYARVYQALLAPPGSTCALKIAKAELEESRARVERERAFLQPLRHPRLVRLLDAGRHDGLPFLVLEWLDGETAADLLHSRRRVPLRQAAELTEGVAEALAYLHEMGLAHGDLRLQNVIVVPKRGPVLTDPGTIPGADPPSPAADVRAAACLFHLLVTGDDPTKGGLRLLPGAGYNKLAVELWEKAQADSTPTAAELLAMTRALRRAL
jgi:serine/threonine protein kinase